MPVVQVAFGYLRHGRVEGNSVGFAIVIGMVFYVGWYFNNASYKKKSSLVTNDFQNSLIVVQTGSLLFCPT